MKKFIVFAVALALLCSPVARANAAVICTNPTTESYYFGKSYETYADWVADAYINIESVTETDGLDVVIHANVHYDETLIETGLELPLYRNEDGTINENYDAQMQEIMAVMPYGRIFAVVQFLRYDTLNDKTTYKQIIHDIAPDKIVVNDMYDTGSGYDGRTDLMYQAGLYFRNECGLEDTNLIISTGKPQGVSVVEDGREVIYKTKIVGVYGYLENATIKSKQTYKIPQGDMMVCDDYADIQAFIGEYGRQSVTDFENNVETATGQVMGAVGESVGGLFSMLTGMLTSVGSIPLLIGSLFSFFPGDVQVLLGALVAVAVLIAIIKIAT